MSETSTSKRILITGATDGIGLETARMLAFLGHHVLLHGRNAGKLAGVEEDLKSMVSGAEIEGYVADLSQRSEAEKLAREVSARHETLDVLINNAGVFKVPSAKTPDGLDVRFAVNSIAPYLLTQRLLPLFGDTGRVINLSSAAQSDVDIEALFGRISLSDGEAYAQSKLALTIWSRSLAIALGDSGPVIIAVNPGSFLGSKMVQEAYGKAGKNLRIGAEILARAALDDEFATASGQYFDNDSGQFASPHPDALDPFKAREIIEAIESILAKV